MPTIQFPYAVDDNDRLWHIDDVPVDADLSFRCICDEKMAPRALKSVKVSRHFYHIGEPCPSEYRLHEIAKRFIQEGINAGSYRLGVRCSTPSCEGILWTKQKDSQAVCELSLIPNTRSDIVIFKLEEPSIIIEIVVTHDLEDTTHEKYMKSSYPVFVVHPTLEGLRELKHEAVASFLLGDQRGSCPNCVEYRRKIDADLTLMRNAPVSNTRGSRAALRELGFVPQSLHPVAQEITRKKYPRFNCYNYPMPESLMSLNAYPDRPRAIRLQAQESDYSGDYSQWLIDKVKTIISDKYPTIDVTTE